MNPRMPTVKDREGIRKLWKDTFDDSDSFINWYFDKRYNRAFSTCLEKDGKIVSAMQGYPFNLRIRGRIIQASMLSGVSTDKDYRGQGLMTRVFSYHMKQVRDSGIPLVFHTPANTPTFFSKGHFPVSLTKILTLDPIQDRQVNNIYDLSSQKAEYGNLFRTYTKWSLPYSGIIGRSLADFNLKMEDYSADGAKIAMVRDGDIVKAYGIFYRLEEYIHVEEIAYDSPASLTSLLKDIASLNLQVRAKLPVDSQVDIEIVKSDIKYQGVCGVANIKDFLKGLFPQIPSGYNHIKIEVKDHMLENNNGCFFLDGSIAEGDGHLVFEVGRLSQVLFGFVSLKEQEKEKQVIINDRDAFNLLNKLLNKLPCFIVDEY